MVKVQQHRFYFTNFNFKFRTCRLFLRRSYSNVFITMTDLRNKVIICKTAGSCELINNSKRKKIVPQVIEIIFKEIYKNMQHFKITNVDLVLNMRLNIYYYILMKELSYYGITLSGISVRRKVPHNGVKGRLRKRK